MEVGLSQRNPTSSIEIVNACSRRGVSGCGAMNAILQNSKGAFQGDCPLARRPRLGQRVLSGALVVQEGQVIELVSEIGALERNLPMLIIGSPRQACIEQGISGHSVEAGVDRLGV